MKRRIAYCGLDCETCEARIATLDNDDALRAKVAQKWSEMNGMEIKPEWINCEGCKADGVKTAFCESLCTIRSCARGRSLETCGSCAELRSCEKAGQILDHSEEARKNLGLN